MPSGIANGQRDHHRDEHLRQRPHRQIPHAEQPESSDAGERTRPPAATPETRHPTNANAPAIIHHGTPTKSDSSGSRSRMSTKSLIALVVFPRCSCDQSTMALAGVATENSHPSGNDC